MSTNQYTWTTDDNGSTGWLQDGRPNFDVAGGALIAHDVLEHLPRGQKHGPAEDELLALGARFYLRVASGWWWNQSYMTSVPNTWASELLNIYHSNHGNLAPRAVVELDDEDMECELQASLRDSAKMISEECEIELADDDPFIVNAGAWLRTGFRAAEKRYKGTDPLNIMWLAECIEKECDRFKGEEGERLIVRVHEKDQTFTVTHKQHEWNQ